MKIGNNGGYGYILADEGLQAVRAIKPPRQRDGYGERQEDTVPGCNGYLV